MERQLSQYKEDVQELEEILRKLNTHSTNITDQFQQLSDYDCQGTDFVGTQAEQYLFTRQMILTSQTLLLTTIHLSNEEIINQNIEQLLICIEELKEAIREQEEQE